MTLILSFSPGALIGMTSTIQGTISTTHLSIPCDQLHGNTSAATGMGLLEKKREKKPEINMKGDKSMEAAVGPSKWSKLPVINGKSKVQLNNTIDSRLTMQYDSSVQNGKESSVFKGRLFCFSNSFPEDRVISLNADFTSTIIIISNYVFFGRVCNIWISTAREVISFNG